MDTKFGDYSLPCPRNADKYLDATYGEDWRKTGRSQSYNHITRENQGRSIMILGHFIGNSIRYISCNLQVASVYYFEIGTWTTFNIFLELQIFLFSSFLYPFQNFQLFQSQQTPNFQFTLNFQITSNFQNFIQLHPIFEITSNILNNTQFSKLHFIFNIQN